MVGAHARFGVLLGIILTIGVVAPVANQPAAAAPQSPPLASSYNDLGLRLFGQIAGAAQGQNLLLSPLSVALALSMAYNGAEGDTRAAMARVLGVEGLTLDETNRAGQELRQALENADPKVTLAIANSLWASQGLAINPDFVERVRAFFAAQSATLDFRDPGAADTVNQWVRESTRERIARIADRFEPDTVMVLLNAIYFKGSWTQKFDEARTRNGSFHLADGARKTVPMMSQSGRYQYQQSDRFQAVGLPYGDGRLSMYIFLPAAGLSLGDFLTDLTAENWNMWMSRWTSMEGDVALPRFRMEYDVTLNDALKALGMEVAFTDRADFAGIVTPPPTLYIDQVLHKSFIEVNEEGTEAAAVTGVVIRPTSLPVRFSFVADRPFHFAIRDNETGTLLFMGALADPQ